MIFWPDILAPQSVTIQAQGASRSAGRSIGGVERVTLVDAGWWTARIAFPRLKTPIHVAEYRGLLARLRGRSGTVLAPFFDCRHTPGGLQAFADPDGYANAYGAGGVPFDDDATFDDGALWGAQVVAAKLDLAVAAQATEAYINVISAHSIRPGHYFSIGYRAYVVCEVLAVAGTQHRVTFWPPAREAAAALAEVQFDRPSCVMRLAADDGAWPDLQLLRFASPVLDLVEA